MNRSRRQRLRARLSIVMIAALLWSQFAMAAHSVCAVADLSQAVATIAEPGCHQPTPPAESAVCSAHCSQGDQSNDVGRVPLVPALAVASASEFSAATIVQTPPSSYAELPPPVSWHRPTAHPASLLLI